MALIKDYFSKTEKYISEYGENTIVLMQVGAFYEVYGLQNKTTGDINGSQIVAFSQTCDLNIADKKICVGKEGVVMAGFSHYMIDKYLKKLQEAGFTVIVYTQDEQAKNTTRSLSGIYSPGTYFSLETNSKITNNISCIWVHVSTNMKSRDKQIHVGIANIDIYTGKSTIFEFNELFLMNPTTFDELDRFNSIHNPSEVILVGNVCEKDMDNIINYGNIQCKSIHKIRTELQTENAKRANNCEKQTYQKTVLEKFFNITDFDVFSQNFYENAIATQAYCYLLDFIYQHNPNLVNKLQEPIFDNSSERLILANHSLKQLNIIDDGNYTGKFSSVEKLLNQCVTPMGKRKFSHFLLNPTTNSEHLNEEYNITEHILAKHIISYPTLKNKLQLLKDVSKIGRQLVMKKISPKTMLQFYNNLLSIKGIYASLIKDKLLLAYFHKRMDKNECTKIAEYCDVIIKFLEDNLVLSLCDEIETTQQFEVNFIKNGVDVELDNKKQLLLESTNKLEAIRAYFNDNIMKYEKKAKATDYVKLHETEKNSFSLVATKRRCNNLKEIVNKDSSTVENVVLLNYISSEDGQTQSTFNIKLRDNLFLNAQTASNDSISNPDITELCKSMSSVKIQMKDLISGVYNKILNKMDEFQTHILAIVDFITIVDVIFTKANIAKTFNYCKPTIVASDKSYFNARDLRHCLIEHLQQNELYVSNDIALGNNVIDGILLYGTNAVGKTSLIRAAGIAVVMAQAGLYVPCTSFQFSPYQYIFTRILGNDNMFKNLSSFAVEMYELRTILRLANERSLVLGDELCSGTESISATSIFVAGIQNLNTKKSSFIFATHLHEIINYEEICELKTVVLKHMAVIYDREKDLLIYDRKIKDGPGDNMYGLEVCKSLNLPSDFIESAHNIRMKYHPTSASILSLKTSHFNIKKIVGMCELCGKEPGKEVHHLQHQNLANENGHISNATSGGGESFHKNHVANLMTLCEKCHDKIHKEKKTMHKKVKTSKGTVVQNIYL
jgi:DNA mismatch repair protein MutS